MSFRSVSFCVVPGHFVSFRVIRVISYHFVSFCVISSLHALRHVLVMVSFLLVVSCPGGGRSRLVLVIVSSPWWSVIQVEVEVEVGVIVAAHFSARLGRGRSLVVSYPGSCHYHYHHLS